MSRIRWRYWRTNACQRDSVFASVKRVRPVAREPLPGFGTGQAVLGSTPSRLGLRGWWCRRGRHVCSVRVDVGRLSDAEMVGHLARCRAVAFVPWTEDYGFVTVEAFSCSKPVVTVTDSGGPAELVTEQTGYSVPLAPRAEIVAALGRTLEHIVQHPEELERKRFAARERVEHWFTWDAKAGQTLEVYDWVLGRGPKPDFGTPFPDVEKVTPESVDWTRVASGQIDSVSVASTTRVASESSERGEHEGEEVA